MSSTIDLDDYTCADKGLFLPIINEYTWSLGIRIFLYLLGMIWCFLGIAIVADMFMLGIEKITSKTRMIKISNPKAKNGYEEIEVKVWNDTVANLSLMAFGTSAPEILLNVVVVCGSGFKPSDLGPATIVGSAAFNLLVITAICICSIPMGESRKLANIRVYSVTTFFSLFAYVWLILVLLVITPDVVDLWEAIVTFLLFPVLIVTSFFTDKLYCCRRSNKTSSEVEIGIDIDNNVGKTGASRDDTVDIIHLAKELGKYKIPEEEAAKIAANKLSQNISHNSGWYRIQATRKITGGQRLVPKVKSTFKDLYLNVMTKQSFGSPEKDTTSLSCVDLSENGRKAVVEFTSASCAVLENEGKVRLEIRRYGRLDLPVAVKLETIDGTAEAVSDYVPVKTVVKFDANETSKDINIEIVDDDIWEPDEFFFAKLFIDHDDERSKHVALGSTSINQITIINDDEPGTFEFSKPSYVVREGNEKVQLFVKRINGADGLVKVNWQTKDMSAKSGKDYISGEGTLEFQHGETQKTIEITILDTDEDERDCSYSVELTTAASGAKIGKIGKTIVTIVNDEEFHDIVTRIAAQTKQNLDSLKLESSTWKEQFHNAMNVNGGDIENATNMDYAMHFVSFFWKVLFAFIPPPSYCGGWLTFSLSLAMIGVLTTIVGDLASIFGCLIGLNDLITAITFVALGTSMPDTFASRQAALQEKFADSSIGNINGSNAVNVFLGLGLPWLIATIYWEAKGEAFEYPSGSLAFSVVLYLSTAVFTIILLLSRRRIHSWFGGAELGGKVVGKWVSAASLILLWIFYVVMSSLKSVGKINASI
ncbi:sodium/calcium exchanger 3-like isoform X2 [Mercenaria mercenaria]|uniref:sodium/calcium exchanger 3-like isoform X2 n=1 Tax=Mercenaria mercenaria TaxID=6596 RepID=UPI001E1DAAD6|nr:sodium/calcium exchanger 3-like isoform X2 [Mercenaria mercenaria]